MPEQVTLREPADRTRIDLEKPREFSYWCAALNVVPDQLRAAVAAVGPNADDVRRYLGLEELNDGHD
ncbi:DUF3606 domain-containing protein [Bordetella bronchialis]|uniref:DUF3606 domain-containing protein n=1 Tax=Bordetella bronchialis TaxID=463025 RepID=A0A193FR61_9BORD|nr:DUF3606 domain-containing protein [Bordetella bronchialis]ANN70135.1 hypothetical protein BAU08_01140 [Bordetella bronchialis]